MEVTKTDLSKAVAYLRDAAALYDSMPKPKHRWRAVLIRQLSAKLAAKLPDNANRRPSSDAAHRL